MDKITTLELTVQDLPSEIVLDLSDSGGEQVLDRAIESVKSEVLYNSRFDDNFSLGFVKAKVLRRQGSMFTLLLTYENAAAS